MNILLQRIYRGEDCTLGVLSHEGDLLCYTLELPWKENQKNISCIPIGRYDIIPKKYSFFYRKWELQEVCKRTNIQIHAGNTVNDIEGCIVIGNKIGTIAGKKAVFNSRRTIEKLDKFLSCEENVIIVRNL